MLLGLKNLLKTAKKLQIIFEHEPFSLKKNKIPLNQVTKFLQTCGFKIKLIENSGRTKNFKNKFLNSYHDFVATK